MAAATATRRVLLLGATGRLGRHLVQALASRADVALTVLVRNTQKLQDQVAAIPVAAGGVLGEPAAAQLLARVHVVLGDVGEEAALAPLMKAADVCVMCAGYPNDAAPGGLSSLGRLLPLVARTASAELQGPRRFVCLGGAGALSNGDAGLFYQVPGFPPAPAEYSRVHEGNWKELQRISDTLAAAGAKPLPWTMICPGFMTETPETVPTHVLLDRLPVFDEHGAPRTLAKMEMGPLGILNVPYSTTARCITMLALDEPDIDGRPPTDYHYRRASPYLASA